MKNNIVLLIVFFFTINVNINAQSIEIGPEFGFGRIGIKNDFPSPTTSKLFNNTTSEYYRYGFISYMVFDSTFFLFLFKSGLFYNQVGSNIPFSTINNLKMLQLPLGFEIRYGKKFFIFTGSTLDFNYLFPTKTEYLSYAKYQIGIDAWIGLNYKVGNKWLIDFKYQLGRDITKLFSDIYYYHFDGSSREYHYSSNINLCVSIRYKIR
jgi:hypothetical protein